MLCCHARPSQPPAGSLTAQSSADLAAQPKARCSRLHEAAFDAATTCAQRAGVNERVQDVLKTKLNMTLPELKTPDMLSNLTIFGLSSNKTERIGVRLRKQGFRPKHPVVIIPGQSTGRPLTR